MRWVLDTSVLVAAIRSGAGASRVLLDAVLDGAIVPLMSVPLFFEYEDAMKRPEHLLASSLEPEEIDALLEAVAGLCEPVRLAYLWRPTLPDAGDDMVLETAVNGGAEALVTFNVRDFRGLQQFGIPVITPQQAVQKLRSTT